ncbi:Shikimate dehydrogenase [Frankia sp. AiPs1]|uniref:shikimate dehydrogenase family protein n=1 Tax=Frankia sp. AiPa1 TaxID=573492 RepID=UPI00202B26D0|nr:shikimate dehydrogenase [Frankia sp. AiPa1]MCL9759937.1 shikimate dehydrogenase [Frankia sp. AiPa1]
MTAPTTPAAPAAATAPATPRDALVPSAMPVVSGTTRLYAVLGDPVAQVQAPALLNPLFARLAIDAVLVPVHVRPDAFGTVLAGLAAAGNVDGVLVTIPHKAAACAGATLRSTAAQISGSANALRRAPGGGWEAANFDGAGFVRGLTVAGHAVDGSQVSLMGAGGAGSAIAVALLEAGCHRLSIHDPDQAKCADLVARLDAHWPERIELALRPALHDADIVVNATPLGLRPGDPLPFAVDWLPINCLVADIIMKPARTRLLAAAAALGLKTHPGIHMLAEQVDLYQEFFGFAPAGRAAALA